MSFLDQINARRRLLKTTETIITKPDGKRFLQTADGVSELTTATTGFVVDTNPDDTPALITEHLYLGSQDCCNPTTLKNHEISHVLSIGIEPPYKSPSLTHKYIECLDLPETDIFPILGQALAFIKSSLEANGIVLVHCNAGVSRSASVVVAYLMETEGWEYQRALDFVRQSRPCARPNDGFAGQLKHFKS